MENLKLTRIDSRLIHGQVMTRWVKRYNVNHIIVIDDNSAKNPLLSKILIKTVPSGIEAEVLTIEVAAKRWEENNLSEKNLLILFKDVASAVKAWKTGIKYTDIQVGSIAGAAGKKSVASNVVMSEEEMLELKYLHDNNVSVIVQPIPESKPLGFKHVEGKFNI